VGGGKAENMKRKKPINGSVGKPVVEFKKKEVQ